MVLIFFFRTGMVYVDDSIAGKEEPGLWDVPAVPSVASRTFTKGYVQKVGGVSYESCLFVIQLGSYIIRYRHGY